MSTGPSGSELQVLDVLGYYGPVAISELLVQKLWLRREFRADGLQTSDGRRLKVIHPGRWNRLGGPDFLGAEIELDGRRILGDVEVHFYQRDWRGHRHDENAAFDGVVLHVVVFDPDPGEACARTQGGRLLPVLVLAPRIREGLEEYALRDALRSLANQDPLDLAAPLLRLRLPERRERLRAAAGLRWEQKLVFARRRLSGHGWEAACHQVMLEILGYRRNRAPMADIALRYPIEAWRSDAQETARLAHRTFEARWDRQGTRPANHPRHRLEQYARLVENVPDWPHRLATALASLDVKGEPAESTQAYRRRTKLGPWRRSLIEGRWNGILGAPRVDTVFVDGLIPLAAAQDPTRDLYPLWLHWAPGDLPAGLRLFLRTAQVVTRLWPYSNGLQQAALQFLFETWSPESQA